MALRWSSSDRQLRLDADIMAALQHPERIIVEPFAGGLLVMRDDDQRATGWPRKVKTSGRPLLRIGTAAVGELGLIDGYYKWVVTDGRILAMPEGSPAAR